MGHGTFVAMIRRDLFEVSHPFAKNANGWGTGRLEHVTVFMMSWVRRVRSKAAS